MYQLPGPLRSPTRHRALLHQDCPRPCMHRNLADRLIDRRHAGCSARAEPERLGRGVDG